MSGFISKGDGDSVPAKLAFGDTPINRHQADALFATSPADIENEAKMDGLDPQPPEVADYRPHDIDAVACWNCSHFEKTGVGNDSWPTGICHLWETLADGDAVCDKFALDEDAADPMGEDPVSSLFSGAELICSDTDVELATEEDPLIYKTIMKTGTWNKTPSSKGVLQKTLSVVRDGVSDAVKGVISLSELKKNFEDEAYPYVTVPLSDEEGKDHKNLMELNKGYIRKLFIRDTDEGSELRAGFEFTEPDAKGKIERGTYPDVSAGIHFGVVTPEGKNYNSALNHVCITKNPFMRGMGPFGEVLASDESTPEAENTDSFTFSTEQDSDDNLGGAPTFDKQQSYGWRKEKASEVLAAMPEIKDFAANYSVDDIGPESLIVTNKIADTSWVVPFSVSDEGQLSLSGIGDWSDYEVDDEGSEQKDEPAAPPVMKEKTELSHSSLQQAQKSRGLRSRSTKTKNEGGVSMSVNAKDPLEGVDLSDPEAVKAAVAGVVAERDSLAQVSKTGEVDAEIQALREAGFKEEAGFTGFLKTVRDIMLSDDGGPAQVLLSNDDNGNEIGREQITATEMTKKIISSLPTDEKGKLLFSGQALDSGNNDKPDAEEVDGLDSSPEAVKKRTEEASAAIGQPIKSKE